MMKIIYVTIGSISFLLGSIGIVLPVLPTTPFYLLSAFCFAKGSDRFHKWFVHSTLYQNHVESFVKERAMTQRNKVMILSFASSMLLLAMFFMQAWYLRLFLVFLIIFKYYYFVFHIKTIPASKKV